MAPSASAPFDYDRLAAAMADRVSVQAYGLSRDEVAAGTEAGVSKALWRKDRS